MVGAKEKKIEEDNSHMFKRLPTIIHRFMIALLIPRLLKNGFGAWRSCLMLSNA